MYILGSIGPSQFPVAYPYNLGFVNYSYAHILRGGDLNAVVLNITQYDTLLPAKTLLFIIFFFSKIGILHKPLHNKPLLLLNQPLHNNLVAQQHNQENLQQLNPNPPLHNLQHLSPRHLNLQPPNLQHLNLNPPLHNQLPLAPNNLHNQDPAPQQLHQLDLVLL